MFCENCGKEIENGSLFCGHCGEKINYSDGFGDSQGYIDEAVDAAPEHYEGNATDFGGDQGYVQSYGNYDAQYGGPYDGYGQPYDQQQDFPTPPQKTKKNPLVIVLIVVLVVAVLGLGFAAVWFATDGDLGSLFNKEDSSQSYSDASSDSEASADGEEEDTLPKTEQTGNTRILAAYDERKVSEPATLYKDVDYYISCRAAALYAEGDKYKYGQIAQLDVNDIVTVKGATPGSNWVYVYCPELGIFGWIEPGSISPKMVSAADAEIEKHQVSYYEDFECFTAKVKVGSRYHLYLRNVPSDKNDADIIYSVDDQQIVNIIGRSTADSGWYYVYYDSPDQGRLYGFMYSQYLVRQ